MPQVTINEKGIVSESGSGFFVSDGPFTPHLETYTDSATVTITCVPHDPGDIAEGDPGEGNDLDGKYLKFEDAAGDQYYVWFDVADAGAADPEPFGEATGTGFEINDAAADLDTAIKIAALVQTALDADGSLTAVDNGDGTVTVTCLQLGQLDTTAHSRGDLHTLGENEETFAVSISQPSVAVSISGARPATQNTLADNGVSVLGSTAANALTVSLPDGAGAGVRKTLVSSGWAAGTLVVSLTARHTGTRAQNASTATFNAADDVLALMWNNVDELWEILLNSGVTMAD